LTIRDAYPVSPGHTLLITKRHVADFFEATAEEVTALIEALHDAKAHLELSLSLTHQEVSFAEHLRSFALPYARLRYPTDSRIGTN
jgi:hypothetical protein